MIKNVIFDLGGVLLNLDMEKTRLAFQNLGMTDFDKHFNQAKQSGLFDLFDCGKISTEDFRNGLRNHLPTSVTDHQIDEAWNAMLLDLPKERLEMLQSLRNKYRLFLLSNTNEIHIKSFSEYLGEKFGFTDFSNYFERHYYSCRIGMRKPDKEIFQFVLSENNLVASETLFIDDSQQHVKGALSCGIHSVLLDKNELLSDLLKRTGIAF